MQTTELCSASREMNTMLQCEVGNFTYPRHPSSNTSSTSSISPNYPCDTPTTVLPLENHVNPASEKFNDNSIHVVQSSPTLSSTTFEQHQTCDSSSNEVCCSTGFNQSGYDTKKFDSLSSKKRNQQERLEKCSNSSPNFVSSTVSPQEPMSTTYSPENHAESLACDNISTNIHNKNVHFRNRSDTGRSITKKSNCNRRASLGNCANLTQTTCAPYTQEVKTHVTNLNKSNPSNANPCFPNHGAMPAMGIPPYQNDVLYPRCPTSDNMLNVRQFNPQLYQPAFMPQQNTPCSRPGMLMPRIMGPPALQPVSGSMSAAYAGNTTLCDGMFNYMMSSSTQLPYEDPKRKRFQRTADVLQQSGLMDITMKTAALIKDNQRLQKELDSLRNEVMQQLHVIRQGSQKQDSSQSSVLANSNQNTKNSRQFLKC